MFWVLGKKWVWGWSSGYCWLSPLIAFKLVNFIKGTRSSIDRVIQFVVHDRNLLVTGEFDCVIFFFCCPPSEFGLCVVLPSSRAAAIPRAKGGTVLQMKLVYNQLAPLFLLFLQWMDCSCAGFLHRYLNLFHIIIYKVSFIYLSLSVDPFMFYCFGHFGLWYPCFMFFSWCCRSHNLPKVHNDGRSSMSTHGRKATIGDFYGAWIFDFRKEKNHFYFWIFFFNQKYNPFVAVIYWSLFLTLFMLSQIELFSRYIAISPKASW